MEALNCGCKVTSNLTNRWIHRVLNGAADIKTFNFQLFHNPGSDINSKNYCDLFVNSCWCVSWIAVIFYSVGGPIHFNDNNRQNSNLQNLSNKINSLYRAVEYFSQCVMSCEYISLSLMRFSSLCPKRRQTMIWRHDIRGTNCSGCHKSCIMTSQLCMVSF